MPHNLASKKAHNRTLLGYLDEKRNHFYPPKVADA